MVLPNDFVGLAADVILPLLESVKIVKHNSFKSKRFDGVTTYFAR